MIDTGTALSALPFAKTAPPFEVSEERYPYYQLVPKQFDQNLAFRREMLAWGASSRHAAHELWLMCARDLLFYVNAFCWIHEPRSRRMPVLPFITYPFQDGTFQELESAIGDHDLHIEKSREMGASWMCLVAFEHPWHFQDYQTFMIFSRVEHCVDLKEDPASLFGKLDFLHKMQPAWLLPGYRHLGSDDPNRALLRLHNPDNHSGFIGESTTGNIGRSGRYTAVLGDEYASIKESHEVRAALISVSKCRVYNSTPKGSSNAFAELKETSIRRISLHWPLHPKKNKGLYFDANDKPRSPWYDAECEQIQHPRIIAQELDIDYLASDYTFFNFEVLNRIVREVCRPAYTTGSLHFTPQCAEPLDFQEGAGPLKLWFYPDEDGRPPQDTSYVIGVDVATGTQDATGRGYSYSAASVWDRTTNEKVAEFMVHGVEPQPFAKSVVALTKWFKGLDDQGAFLIWEDNGPGQLFKAEVIRLGYRNIHYRRNERSIGKKRSDLPGWWSTPESKAALLGDYRQALATGDVVNRSRESVEECRFYVFVMANQGVEHSRAHQSEDPSTARHNHGDIVIADAVSWLGLTEVRETKPEIEPMMPDSCFAARREMRQAKQREAGYW